MKADITFDDLFNHVMEFSNCELISADKKIVRIRTVVNESDANPYGYAHGGYLFTLCAKVNDELFVTAQTLHSGATSDVCDVKITNQNSELIAKAQFTLFNTQKIDIK